jgi:hypothetical protein
MSLEHEPAAISDEFAAIVGLLTVNASDPEAARRLRELSAGLEDRLELNSSPKAGLMLRTTAGRIRDAIEMFLEPEDGDDPHQLLPNLRQRMETALVDLGRRLREMEPRELGRKGGGRAGSDDERGRLGGDDPGAGVLAWEGEGGAWGVRHG